MPRTHLNDYCDTVYTAAVILVILEAVTPTDAISLLKTKTTGQLSNQMLLMLTFVPYLLIVGYDTTIFNLSNLIMSVF